MRRYYRHAAALALVGWYLFVPPITLDGVNFQAPLTEQTIIDRFDSKPACAKALGDPDPIAQRAGARGGPRQVRLWREALLKGQCVSESDPRLAGAFIGRIR